MWDIQSCEINCIKLKINDPNQILTINHIKRQKCMCHVNINKHTPKCSRWQLSDRHKIYAKHIMKMVIRCVFFYECVCVCVAVMYTMFPNAIVFLFIFCYAPRRVSKYTLTFKNVWTLLFNGVKFIHKQCFCMWHSLKTGKTHRNKRKFHQKLLIWAESWMWISGLYL